MGLLADSACAIQIWAVSAKRGMAASAILPPRGFHQRQLDNVRLAKKDLLSFQHFSRYLFVSDIV